MMRTKLFTTAIFCLAFFTQLTSVHAQSEWKYDAGLYGWFAGMEGTVGVANQQEQFEASVSDLMKNLTFTAGGHFEAKNPKVSLILDVFYVGLKADAEAKTIGANTVTPNASMEFDEWIIEGSAGYRINPEFEVLLATRFFSLNADLLNGDNTLGSASQSWPAFYLGARYIKEFDKKWYAAIRGDAGYGGNGFAWYANAAVGYRFSELFSLALAYRILNMDYDSGTGLDYFMLDGTTGGFGLGFVFSF
ncbi:MAG: hypothetical protein U5J96_08075 [Ignavibacteriaceae bacterium]|nr:hypothetical protein [Ignavibacteriaceae bacterium]